MSNDPSSVSELRKPWNRTAEAYADLFQGSVTQAIEPVLNAAGVVAGSRVLDVATGPGIIAAAALERGATPKGIDSAEKMVDVARARHPGAEFDVADAAKLPFDDGSFDAAVIGFVLFMMAEPHTALREAHRVLVPGGKVACTVWDWPVPGFDLFYSRMEKYAPEEPMLGGDPPLFGVSDHDVLRNALSQAEFVDPTVERLPMIWELASADHLFDALATLRDFSGLSETALRAFRADVVSAVGEYQQGGRYFIPFPALLLSGRK